MLKLRDYLKGKKRMYYWTDGTELYHHGIKGQKWGIRQYQYEDGSLTPLGRERYGKKSRLVENKAKQAQAIGNTYKKVTGIISGVSAGIGAAGQVGTGIAAAITYGSALVAAPYAAAAAAVPSDSTQRTRVFQKIFRNKTRRCCLLHC